MITIIIIIVIARVGSLLQYPFIYCMSRDITGHERDEVKDVGDNDRNAYEIPDAAIAR